MSINWISWIDSTTKSTKILMLITNNEVIIEYTIHVIQFRLDDIKENNVGFSIAKNMEKKE